MKKQLLTILLLVCSMSSFAQFTTGIPVTLGSSGMTIKIDTDATTVTLTLTGPNTTSLAIGFGGLTMGSVTDMFVWSNSSNRDYTSSGQNPPVADTPATSQSWKVTTDDQGTTTRTVVATRALVSNGDYTFSNSSDPIPIIYSVNGSTTFGRHGTKGNRTLTRTSLGVEDFSLNAAKVYPNPSNGNFIVNSISAVKKLHVYSQIGLFVKTVEFDGNSNQVEINLKGLPSGVYLIELQNDADKAWKKIIIE
jgi:hypothetical protein